MTRYHKWSLVGLLALLSVLVVGVASPAGKESEDPDKPPPLIVAPASKDDSTDIATPNVKTELPSRRGSSDAAPERKSSRRKPSADPDNTEYRPEGGRSKGAKREEMVDTVEKQFAALKPAGGGKKEETDFFVAATIDLVDHKATVDYPVVEGLRKASEQIADFVLDAPENGIRRWRAFGRAKTQKAAEGLRKNARSQSIEGQLDAFKLSRAGRKSPEDYFVVGTAELFKATQHADVRFQVLNGTSATASFLLDFILSGDSNTQRQWHVFFRAKTDEDANKYIQQLREWYDSQESQRAQIAQIYHARTTRRC